MVIKPSFAAGLDGMHKGLTGVATAANEIATQNVPRSNAAGQREFPDLASTAESLVDLKIYSRQFEASVKVVKTADEMVGLLLDELA